MFELVTGGSGSGKSEYAEGRISMLNADTPYYIATMFPMNRESQEKVDRHRRMRRGKGYTTVEHYMDIKALDIQEGSVVLLECMSNLVANEMFQSGGAGEAVLKEVLEGVDYLRKKTKDLIIVTNEVFSDGKTFDDETAKYIYNLAHINCELAKQADIVTEVVYSIPVYHKGADLVEHSS